MNAEGNHAEPPPVERARFRLTVGRRESGSTHFVGTVSVQETVTAHAPADVVRRTTTARGHWWREGRRAAGVRATRDAPAARAWWRRVLGLVARPFLPWFDAGRW